MTRHMNAEVIPVHHLLELEFHVADEIDQPYATTAVAVRFKSPQGDEVEVPGFWDGGQVWKVRFAPPLCGKWTWERVNGHAAIDGLSPRTGSFEAAPYDGANPIYRHGFLKVNGNGRGFAHQDGTPFFWLGDTAWAATSKASVEEWAAYLERRSGQGFNIVQINSLPQFDASGTPRQPFVRKDSGDWDLQRIDPSYFQYLDRMMDMASESGMFIAMIAIWFNYVEKKGNSRNRFDPESADRYARYIAARYAAYGVVWLVSGDSRFNESEDLEAYDAAARAIRAASPYPPLMSSHLCGDISTPDVLNEKDWLDFHMYQSGHFKGGVGISRQYAAANRALSPVRPVLNGEPCYEQIGYFRLPERVSQKDVRRVAWVSVLSGGNAGLTYGAHGLWAWHHPGEAFEYEEAWLDLKTWEEALHFNGAYDVSRMKAFIAGFPWWKLEPRNDLLVGAGESDCIVAASAEDEQIIIIYADGASEIRVNARQDAAYKAAWLNVSTGQSQPCDYTKDGAMLRIPAPESAVDDAVYVLTRV